MVGEAIALRVAEQEKGMIQAYLDGFHGDEEKARAERLGLSGIVEERHERAVGWQVRDLITGETFVRPFKLVLGRGKARQEYRRGDKIVLSTRATGGSTGIVGALDKIKDLRPDRLILEEHGEVETRTIIWHEMTY